MLSIELSRSPVNSMSDDERALNLSARLKRDVAFHRVAQVLADAIHCRRGESPRGLSTMAPEEREWFKQNARQVVEIFEQMTAARVPDAEADAAAERARVTAERTQAALENRMAIERSRASLAAQERGHDMQPWHASLQEIGVGINRARCYRCDRHATITLGDDPVLSGSALTEGCLVAAETETR